MVLSLAPIVLFTSCTQATPSLDTTPSPELKLGHVTIQDLSQKQVRNRILKAGRKNGWIMTKFGGNAVIAENIGESDDFSTTVTFDTNSFNIDPANSELQNILKDSLGN